MKKKLTHTLKINFKVERNSRKGKQRNKCRKNIIGLKISKLKLYKMRKETKWKKKEKRKKKKKENSTELQKPNIEAEFLTTIKM